MRNNVFDFSGAPALTTRGFVEADFAKVAGFIDQAVEIGNVVAKKTSKFCSVKMWLENWGFQAECCPGSQGKIMCHN
jgi:hypothetical protein